MGILERIREPKRPPLGVAPPGALRVWGAGVSLDLEDDELSTSRRRNCSLFIVAMRSVRNRRRLTSVSRSRRSGLAPDKIKSLSFGSRSGRVEQLWNCACTIDSAAEYTRILDDPMVVITHSFQSAQMNLSVRLQHPNTQLCLRTRVYLMKLLDQCL